MSKSDALSTEVNDDDDGLKSASQFIICKDSCQSADDPSLGSYRKQRQLKRHQEVLMTQCRSVRRRIMRGAAPNLIDTRF